MAAAFLGLPALLAGGKSVRAEALAPETDMILGNPDARVTVIEYASMTCPHCAKFHTDAMPAIKKAYLDTGKIKFVFREFPLDRAAFWGSILARCSGKDRFFGFIDLMFKRQNAWAAGGDPMQALIKLGSLGGVGEAEFKACLADKKLGDGILKTRQTASKEFEINATPGFVINGKKAEGVHDYKTLAAHIDPMLR
jgi:protein-disulfide isomerase